MTIAKFGSQLCQRDSYATENDAKVIECKKVEDSAGQNDLYQVVLSDSVFFAEGGGQPNDKGTIADIPVVSTFRDGSTVRYTLGSPLEVGKEVKVEIDWMTRLDQMQQHSGQHLISAMAVKHHNAETGSWAMSVPSDDGEVSPSFLILDCKPSEELRMDLEKRCNEAIQLNLAMTPKWVEPGTLEAECLELGKLPEGTEGPLRIVSIDGIDNNMCCGTHVKSLGMLQAIKIISVEPFKGSKCKLVFAAGNRVLQLMNEMYKVERSLNKLLSCPPSLFAQRVEEVLLQQRQAGKKLKTLQAQLATQKTVELRQNLESMPVDQRVISIHEPDLDASFAQNVAKNFAKDDVVLLLAYGTSPGGFLLLAPKKTDLCSSLGPKVAELLKGKGGGGKGKFQGKSDDLSKFKEASELVHAAVKNVE